MEIFEVYKEFIKPEILILIPVLYLIGYGLKNSKIKDKLIPLSLGIIGILLAGLYVLATCDIKGGKEIAMALFTAITQGILVAGASVYFNQIYKQSKKKN
jgi:hypothetical protein